ncbi:MAG: hypothetical protein GX311_01715 [Bacteroidales bacterium]|nr:hypothetical protein [Bacteroidales bacterium]
MAVKGTTNNPRGRPKGTPNKVTKEMREWIKEIINEQRPQLKKDLKQLDPVERWRIVEKLLQYVLPKMQSIEGHLNFNKMTDEDLNKLANELVKTNNDIIEEAENED